MARRASNALRIFFFRVRNLKNKKSRRCWGKKTQEVGEAARKVEGPWPDFARRFANLLCARFGDFKKEKMCFFSSWRRRIIARRLAAAACRLCAMIRRRGDQLRLARATNFCAFFLCTPSRHQERRPTVPGFSRSDPPSGHQPTPTREATRHPPGGRS